MGLQEVVGSFVRARPRPEAGFAGREAKRP
jgi:hypothetical protein